MEGQFYKLPQVLFSEKYSNISNDSKLLYALMLDRTKLSELNGWRGENGRVYIIFAREEACRVLGFGKDKAARVYSELEENGLIEQKKQYLARPTLIYVNEISERGNSYPADEEQAVITAENTASKDRKTKIRNIGISASIKTYPNQNETSQLDNIKTYPSHADANDGIKIQNSKALKAHLNSVLEIDTLKQRYPLSVSSLEEIRDIIAEVISLRKRVTFEGKVIPAETAAERFEMLTAENVCMVLDALSQTESDIRRIDAYIATALYGSTFTVSSRNEVGWRTF